MRTKRDLFAELDNPAISCGGCHFTSSIEGHWLEQEGHLVFVADPDPQPRRGPDLFTCGECGTEFAGIRCNWGREELDSDVLAAVRKTAQKARELEWDSAHGGGERSRLESM